MGKRRVLFDDVIPQHWVGSTIQEVLRAHLGLSNRQRQKVVRTHGLRLDRKRAHSQHLLTLGQRLQVSLPQDEQVRLAPKAMELEILVETESLLIINKPDGLQVHPVGKNSEASAAAGAADLLEKRYGHRITPRPVHRLDRAASGILVFALRAEIQEELSQWWNTDAVHKQYVALVFGHVANPFRVETPIQGKSAATWIDPIGYDEDRTLVRCHLHTGRHHQIRRHLAEAGFPILGDDRYAPSSVQRVAMRLCLHKERFSVDQRLSFGPLDITCKSPDWQTVIGKERSL